MPSSCTTISVLLDWSVARAESGTSNAGGILARHASAPLSVLLYELGKMSDNFYAEMVFKSLGGEAKGRPAHASDSADVVTRWLAKVGASQLN